MNRHVKNEQSFRKVGFRLVLASCYYTVTLSEAPLFFLGDQLAATMSHGQIAKYGDFQGQSGRKS